MDSLQMMPKSAMSAVWDCTGEPLYDFESDEWLLFNYGFNEKEVNDPSIKPSKSKIAEQVLHDIEELGKDERDDWLEEFPLFEEIQSLRPCDDAKPLCGLKVEDLTDKQDLQEQPSPNDSVLSAYEQASAVENLFSAACENSGTFFFTNENILYVDPEPSINLTPMKPEYLETIQYSEGETSAKESDEEPAPALQAILAPLNYSDEKINVKMEMAMVDEIIRNRAQELDQWESDTSRSETSSDGLTGPESSPNTGDDENDDPEWKPEASKSSPGRYHGRRSNRSLRGGSLEDKRLRKKEQNKNASTRYRLRKKAEVCEILKEEELLREKKSKLEGKLCDVQNEIRFIKGLMRDLFKAKGFIN